LFVKRPAAPAASVPPAFEKIAVFIFIPPVMKTLAKYARFGRRANGPRALSNPSALWRFSRGVSIRIDPENAENTSGFTLKGFP
jgi:hypothetical protein